MADILARQRTIIGTTADWAAHDITLGDGELAVERAADGTVRAKVGNGAAPFSASPYLGPPYPPGMIYRGNADVTAAPPAAAPGDFFTATAGGTIDASWGPPAAGTVVAAGQIIAKDSTGAWNVVGQVVDVPALEAQIANKADRDLGNVPGIDRTINLGDFHQLAGPVWPFQDLIADRESFGTVAAPLVPVVVPPEAFITSKLMETYIGPGSIGGVQGALDLMQMRGVPDPASANQNYVTRVCFASTVTGLGGTGLTMGNSRGGLFGFHSAATAYPGATNLLNITAAEMDVQVQAGASVAYKCVLQLCGIDGDDVQGSVYDMALAISKTPGAVGFNYGIQFHAGNGAAPVKPTGTLIGLADSPTHANGVDWRGATFSNGAFVSNGFKVDNDGNVFAKGFWAPVASPLIRLGDPSVASNPAIQFLSSGNPAPNYDSSINGFGGSGVVGTGGITVHAGLFAPATDNACALGAGGQRWTQLFAATATINTSDLTHKTVLGSLADAEYSAVLDAIGAVDLIAYLYNEAVEEKGDGARIHAGIGAQALFREFEARGLDPFKYSVLCRDAVDEEFQEEFEAERPKQEVTTLWEDVIEIENGKAIRRSVPRDVEHDAMERVPLFDADGEPMMFQPRDNGEPYQLTHAVPIMETYTATRTARRPMLDEKGEPVWLWGIRYSEFFVLRQAWLERELHNAHANP